MKYFLILIMLLSTNTNATEPIKLILENHDNIYLYLCLKNISEESVLVNKRFSYSGYLNPSEVVFTIIDKEGIELPFQARVKIGPLTEKDIYLLKPGESTCVEFSIKKLASIYCLKAGQYRAEAIYQNNHFKDKGVFFQTLVSDWVTFEVKEDIEYKEY